MQDFKKLSVWQKSHRLTLDVYKATKAFPKDEMYGLTSQARRSGASIPANIAEGCGREGMAELGRFLKIASGSAHELEYHLLLARDLEYITGVDHSHLESQVLEVKMMIAGLIQKLKTETVN
jgi:four helix bundle protein